MKNLRRIDEAVGSILERRVAADRLLKDVIKGSTSSVEGIKLSKEMAQAFLDWQSMSTYGRKFGKLPFYMLFTAAFNWGLERYIGKDKKIKAEYKELKTKAKEMSKQQKMKAESVNEVSLGHAEVKKVVKHLSRNQKIALERAIKDGIIKTSEDLSNWAKSLNEKRSSPFGEIMLDIDAASKQVKLPMRWMKDYVKSIERMAKRNAKRFFKDYGSFSVDDWAEDMEYNFANESKVNEAKFSFSEDQVKDVADLIAKAIAKLDKSKTAVHDMEYDAGRGAGFEISMDGEKYDGGSYVVRPNGEVYNAAIGNSFPNAVYAKIGDKDINKIIKNIKKFESVEVNESEEDFKPHMMYDPKTGKGYKADKYEDHVRMDKMGYVHEKPEKVDEAKLPKRFTVKKKQTIDGTIYSPGDYALKKKRAGGGIYLNMDKGEMLGVDARNIAKLEEAAPKMKFSPFVDTVIKMKSNLSGLENMMKYEDSNGYAKSKGDFSKVKKALDKLSDSIKIHGKNY